MLFMKKYYDRIIGEFKSLSNELRGDGKIVNINLHRDSKKKGQLLYMQEEKWEYLKQIAYDHGITNKSLIKIILEDFIKKYKKSEYLFERFGI